VKYLNALKYMADIACSITMQDLREEACIEERTSTDFG
jgi:hypothetical protein